MCGATYTNTCIGRIYPIIITLAVTHRAGNRTETAFNHRHQGSVRRIRVAIKTVFIEGKFGIGIKFDLSAVGHFDLCESISPNQDGVVDKDLGLAYQVTHSPRRITGSDCTGGSQHCAYRLIALRKYRQAHAQQQRQQAQ